MMTASSQAIHASLGPLRRFVGPSLALIAPMRTALVCFPTKVRTGLNGSHYSYSCLGI